MDLIKMIKIIVAFLAVIQVSACIGTHFVHRRTIEYGYPNQDTGLRETAEEILKYRGEPDKVRRIDEQEWWYYDRKVAWRGVVAWLIVPIPLLVPIGRNETVYEFNNGIRIDKVVKDTGYSGFVCGAIFVPDGGYWGCETL